MTSKLLVRLARASKGTVHRRVLSAAMVLAVFTLLGNAIGAAKDVVVAHRFGTADELDAFLLALLFPSFAMGVVASSLNSALMPVYVEERAHGGPAAAQRLLSTTMAATLVLLLAAAAAVAVLSPSVLQLVSGTFTHRKLRLTWELSLILLPCLVLAGTATLWTSVLHAHGRFALPAAAKVSTPAVAVAVLAVFGRDWGIHSLAVGLVLGYAVAMVVEGYALARMGISVRPRWEGFTPAVRRVASQYAPIAAGMLVLGANPIIDQLMAARLAQGSVASLGYGGKLLSLGMGIGATSLGAAILPQFSKLAAEKRWEALQRMMHGYAAVVVLVALPFTIFLVTFSEPVVRLLFERGAFTHGDTLRVARIQQLYLAALPIRLAGVFFVRFMVAARANHVLMWISALNAVLNVVANYVLSLYLGVAGIALSTSVVFTLTNGLTYLCAMRRLRVLRGPAALAPAREAA